MPLGIIFYSILNVTETMLECGIVMDAEEDSYAVGVTVFGSVRNFNRAYKRSLAKLLKECMPISPKMIPPISRGARIIS